MKTEQKNQTLAFCTICGKNFIFEAKSKKAPKYCTAACKQKAYRIKHNKTKKLQAAATINTLKLSLKQAQETIQQLKEKLKKNSLIVNELKKELAKYTPKNLFDKTE